jgi:hypothetical protein
MAAQSKAAGRSRRAGLCQVCIALAFSLVVALAAGALTGCGEDVEDEGSEQFAIDKHYQYGDAGLTLKVSRDRLTVADSLDLVLEATAPEQEKIRFPAIDDKLGEFRVASRGSRGPRLVAEGRIIERRSYRLEPFLAGEYTIPAMTVRFESAPGDGEVEVIESEPLTIHVESVLPASEQQPDIKEIQPPVELPGPGWLLYGGVGLALLALALGVYVWWRRRRPAKPPEPPPLPHEVAYRELDALLAADLVRQGRAKLFYLRLSNILRRYIEERFGLRAPERTTEEFLVDLRSSEEFEARHKDLLRDFLRHCDMVKFAEHQPTNEEIDRAVESCRRFIAETHPRPEPPQPVLPLGQNALSQTGPVK